MNELCHRCGGTGNDPEHSGACGECWAVNSTQREYDVVGDGFYAELCRLFDEHATRLHKVPGTFTHQLALVAADFTRKHIHTVATPSDEVAQRARVAGLEEAANRLKDYRLRCEQTGCELADKEDESSQRMYWRADGASDALETVEQEIRALTATDVRGTCTWTLDMKKHENAVWNTACGKSTYFSENLHPQIMKFCAFCGKSLVEAVKENDK